MYARALLLRNCGRYTLVRSDFGSDYITCRFVSEESLYAGLTREQARKFGRIEPNMGADFAKAYDISAYPVWFTPGVFIHSLDKEFDVVHTGRLKYNVIEEARPSTSESIVYDKKGEWKSGSRNNLATFGSIESVLPNQLLYTIGISEDKELLSRYQRQDVYLMGKKRTMFEVVDVSEVTSLEEEEFQETVPVQVQMNQLNQYASYTILDVNARYFLVEGTSLKCWRVNTHLLGKPFTKYLPGVFVERAEELFSKK
ncbi:hypothetical protein DNHGIG_18110 [Collibacillus ludicampi]|uniref:Uncharacterized protein n=1 Tax=Collibacillus ludicampi TaxID=2771369 RepID=A0AAV4LEM9_9BACL|nr:hypothetical protein [Collibacillus ludicampi]GIM46262.1 hypothetical protein DNHGIG_18110 [Collibacillus ludicampi]